MVDECRAELDGQMLILENRCIRREYHWNKGHLTARRIVDLRAGHAWSLVGEAPDCTLSGVNVEPADATLTVTPQQANAFRPAHLRVDVTVSLGALQVRRRFCIYPGCPAIAYDLYLRGTLLPQGQDLHSCKEPHAVATLDRLCLATPHLRLQAVQFFDITDRRNTLVADRTILPYRHATHLEGNLLLVQDLLSEHGLFLLKEAPCSDVQLAGRGYDFACRIGEIQVVGMGLEVDDLDETEWTRGYGVVTGIAAGGEQRLLSALRTYQEQIRLHKPDRDEMILLNTWGDRGQDTRISEAFCLAELDQAARLGITHFQLDDGWQTGRSSNSAYAGGSLEDIWSRDDYWAPHPERFPSGLNPVVQRGRELGIEVCLWFNPSRDDSYAHWREDADTLIALYRLHGIRTFKIDGVLVPDKRADLNLRAMFERVMAATGGEAVFNLDVTAGQRWGYHYGNEYGNIFLENRYTDWSNYYPHWTLRNLWMLSRYLPAQNLQIEFLNRWRNADRYPANDPLAPQRVPFAYCFAITMAAQPLAWFEATGLPEEAFEIAPLIHTYRAHQPRIHTGQIWPIGEEPSGASWTGFQSLDPQGQTGYLILYRELNQRPEAHIKLLDLAGRTVHATCIAGQGADFISRVNPSGECSFALPDPFSFALYAYRAD